MTAAHLWRLPLTRESSSDGHAGPVLGDLCALLESIAAAARAASEPQLPRLITGRLAALCSARLQTGRADATAQLPRLLALLLAVGGTLQPESGAADRLAAQTQAEPGPSESLSQPASPAERPSSASPQQDSSSRAHSTAEAVSPPRQQQHQQSESPAAQHTLEADPDRPGSPQEGSAEARRGPEAGASPHAEGTDQDPEPAQENGAQHEPAEQAEHAEDEVPAEPSWGSGIGTAPDNPFRGTQDQTPRSAAAGSPAAEDADEDDWGDDFEGAEEDQAAKHSQQPLQADSVRSACLQASGPSTSVHRSRHQAMHAHSTSTSGSQLNTAAASSAFKGSTLKWSSQAVSKRHGSWCCAGSSGSHLCRGRPSQHQCSPAQHPHLADNLPCRHSSIIDLAGSLSGSLRSCGCSLCTQPPAVWRSSLLVQHTS